MSGHGKSQPDIHSAGVMLDRGIKEFLDLGKRNDLIETRNNLCSAHPQQGAVEEDIFTSGQFRMKSRTHLKQTSDPPAQLNVTFSGVSDARKNLEQSAFSRPIAANDRDHFTFFNVKINVAQGPKIVPFSRWF